EMDELAAPYYKDLVEHNPSVATFTTELVDVFNGRVVEAEREDDRKQVAAWSRDAVAFWNRLVQLYPELPDLKKYADEATKHDAKVAQWLAQPATGHASSTQP